MKKVLAGILAILMALSLAACGRKTEADLVNDAMKRFDALQNGELTVTVTLSSEQGIVEGFDAVTKETLTFVRDGRHTDALYRSDTAMGDETVVTEMKMQGGKVYSLVEGAWQEQGDAGGSFAPFGGRLKNGIAVVTTTEWDTGTEYTFEMNEKALADLNKQAPEGQQVLESSATYLVNPEGLLVGQRVTSRARVTVDGKTDQLFSETETTLTAWNQPDVTIE